jgi:hypothetical protein
MPEFQTGEIDRAQLAADAERLRRWSEGFAGHMARLRELREQREAGTLSDEAFLAAKADLRAEIAAAGRP